MSDEPEVFKQWAIVEIMGHRTLAGLVSEATIAGAGFLRVDVPRQDGATVTKFIRPTSVFEMHPCTEEVATARAHRLFGIDPVKPADWSPQLPERTGSDDDEIEDDQGELAF